MKEKQGTESTEHTLVIATPKGTLHWQVRYCGEKLWLCTTLLVSSFVTVVSRQAVR